MIKSRILVMGLTFIITSCGYIGLLNPGSGRKAIKRYEFPEKTKNEIYKAIIRLKAEHPQYQLPQDTDSTLLIHTTYGRPGSESYNRWNADSVNFYFYFGIGTDAIILWTRFSGLMDYWNGDEKHGYKSELLLDAISINQSKWKYQTSSDLQSEDRKLGVRLFETEILPKIKSNLY